MILTLIFGVITLVAIVFLILGLKVNGDFAGFAVIGGILGGIPLLFSIVIICCVQNQTRQETIKVMYEQSITQLTSTREYINNLTDDYAKSVAVQQYNIDVSNFKQGIMVEQLKLKNPWISWYHSYAYLKLDANVVSYIE